MTETQIVDTPSTAISGVSTDGKKDLVGLDRAQLATALEAIEEPKKTKMRSKQLWNWMYNRGVTDFGEMTNLSKDLRYALQDNFKVGRLEVTKDLTSKDGTRKWLMRTPDGQEIETVFIPESDRGTLCVSSQVGCTLSCSFCHTGTMKLVRNLTPREIVGQVMVARDALQEWPTPTDGDTRRLSNIVMMGMGEPLYNFDNVRDGLKIAMDNEGISLSKRRITLSTSGVVPMMEKCGEEIGVNLAISLHAVRDDLRDELVPLNKKWNIKALLDACRRYPGVNNARRITFEYVMLKDVNDSPADARELVRLLKGIPAKVNLIPFNPWPGTGYETSTPKAIDKFADIVYRAGYSSPVRKTRGNDILAACGQLKSDSERKRGQSTRALEQAVARA